MILEPAVTLDLDFDEALPAVKAALAEQGFGTLTEIDVKATLQAKIGKEIEPYVIIGACNPNLAGRDRRAASVQCGRTAVGRSGPGRGDGSGIDVAGDG